LAIHLHDLLEDLTRVYTHLFSKLEDLGVKLLKIDIIEVYSLIIILFLLMNIIIH
jgi:hypothetical protein